jgi:hypothetical protein
LDIPSLPLFITSSQFPHKALTDRRYDSSNNYKKENRKSMKKKSALFLSMSMVFLLVACGSNNTTQAQATQAQDAQSQGSGQFAFQGELIPLWKLYTSLLDSDTTAEAELDAVVNSIQDAMTADQMEYIDGMQLGPEDMRQLMDDLGIGFASRGSDNQDSQNSQEGFAPPGGFVVVPGEGPGQGQGGGQGFDPGGGGFGNFSPEQRATAQAMRAEGGGGGRGFFANTALIDALIELLQGKLE